MSEREPDLAELIEERDRGSAPRHPGVVTAARLEEHLLRYDEHLTPAEVAALRLTLMALRQIPARETAARQAGVGHG
jgi:hypothetical protein